MSTAEPEDPLRVQVRFERHPVALRGAFVMRGGDGDPHSLRFESARIERIPGGSAKEVSMDDRLIDVGPTRDLFVPFECSIGDLAPSWYRVRCSVRVDGARTHDYSGRPFVVPWPRREIRRGSFPVDRTVELARRGPAQLVRIEAGWDAAEVLWRADDATARDVLAVVLADGAALETLPDEARPPPRQGPDGGHRRTLGYPVPRGVRELAVLLRRGHQQLCDPVPASL